MKVWYLISNKPAIAVAQEEDETPASFSDSVNAFFQHEANRQLHHEAENKKCIIQIIIRECLLNSLHLMLICNLSICLVGSED